MCTFSVYKNCINHQICPQMNKKSLKMQQFAVKTFDILFAVIYYMKLIYSLHSNINLMNQKIQKKKKHK